MAGFEDLTQRLHVVEHRVHVRLEAQIRVHRRDELGDAVADQELRLEAEHAPNLLEADSIVSRVGNLVLPRLICTLPTMSATMSPMSEIR